MSLQQFSLFHETSGDRLKSWHTPYAEVFQDSGPVLDVGCGPGYFADVLRDLGIESMGVDIDPEMVKMATQRGHKVILGNQESFTERAGQFGGVHVSHVVEHLWGDELETLLKNALTALRPGGILIVRTPNWENRFVRERLFWMDHTHKRPYPGELLIRMMKDLGMVEVQTGFEPTGMNDTFVIAAKPPFTKTGLKVHFPTADSHSGNVLQHGKQLARKKLKAFLEIA